MSVELDLTKTLRQLALEAAASNLEISGWMKWIECPTPNRSDAVIPTPMDARGSFRNILYLYAKPDDNAAIMDYGYNNLWYILANLLSTESSVDTRNTFLPVLATALAIKTEEAVVNGRNFNLDDLTGIMDGMHRARQEGWLSPQSQAAVGRLMAASKNKFGLQIRKSLQIKIFLQRQKIN